MFHVLYDDRCWGWRITDGITRKVGGGSSCVGTATGTDVGAGAGASAASRRKLLRDRQHLENMVISPSI